MSDDFDIVSVRLIPDKKLLSDEPITRPQDAIKVIAEEYKYFDREVFGVLGLNTKNKPINFTIVSIGSLAASIVHPREVFKYGILSNASRLILFHNHPSGDPRPSEEDLRLTKNLEKAGDLLKIEILDHIIIGSDQERIYSLKAEKEFALDDYIERENKRDEMVRKILRNRELGEEVEL